MNLLIELLAFAVAIGVLVVVHEYANRDREGKQFDQQVHKRLTGRRVPCDGRRRADAR